MASIILPKQFLSYYERPEIAWFSVEDDIYYPAIIILDYDGNKGEMMLGVKDHHRSTYNHNEVISITYVKNKIEDDYEEYFNVHVGKEGNSYYVKLVAKDNSNKDLEVIKFSKDTEENINNIIESLKGEDGEDGDSIYKLYHDNIDGTITQDIFLKNLEIVYNFYKNKDTYLAALEQQANTLNTIKEKINYYVDELPIGAIMISYQSPSPSDMWLPFWVDDTGYADEDYPELAAIVKSWGDDFIVDDDHFKLYSSSLPNPYLVVAGGEKYSGELINQAIPDPNSALNITVSLSVWRYYSGTGNVSRYASYGNYRNRHPSDVTTTSTASLIYETDLSCCSDIFKDNIDRLFCPSLGWKFWIKSKALQASDEVYIKE